MEKLRELRRKANITQLDMSKRLGISESYYCQLENGSRRMSLAVAIKISEILNATVEDIFLIENMAKRQVENNDNGPAA
ncbi:helix-turn-helix transcriptional regulator [Tindallia californiensis]|uniref:HTH cro/C1-type domain-containing protein n=1 Tax=Tindallia californiensis TaxID=159292 RepID=A0A1H3QZ09_9FIRM|nr:helix-turn-helix transcriptional regulator [Tindallia californiensis]SDZ18822.1 hypothetical protein/putative transcriptional regulator [Tindallia californiensis]